MDKKLQDRLDAQIRSELHLESILFREVHELGGLAIKFNPTGNAGLPDVMIFYQSLVWLVELKTEKGNVQSYQKLMHEKFARQGHTVRVLKGKDQVLSFIEELKML